MGVLEHCVNKKTIDIKKKYFFIIIILISYKKSNILYIF
jgi:hypothetical protein